MYIWHCYQNSSLCQTFIVPVSPKYYFILDQWHILCEIQWDHKMGQNLAWGENYTGNFCMCCSDVCDLSIAVPVVTVCCSDDCVLAIAVSVVSVLEWFMCIVCLLQWCLYCSDVCVAVMSVLQWCLCSAVMSVLQWCLGIAVILFIAVMHVYGNDICVLQLCLCCSIYRSLCLKRQ